MEFHPNFNIYKLKHYTYYSKKKKKKRLTYLEKTFCSWLNLRGKLFWSPFLLERVIVV